MRILVTGFIGFIGSHFVKHALTADRSVDVIGFGRNSSQKDHQRLSAPYWVDKRLKVVWGDLTDANAMSGLCEGIDVVVNFAAKTFVDHSLKDSRPFHASNVQGAMNLMDDARRYGVKRFIQVSTDEVYGEILEGAYKEDAMLQPRNPYAWSKACADLYAICQHRTYGFPVIVTRTENNFGPWQHRQKVLPTFTRVAMEGKPLPVYGDGLHVRCWLDVKEHCRAIWHLVEQGTPGEIYHIAGEQELTNLDMAKIVLRTLNASETMIQHIDDHNVRPGHDRRYALDCSKLKATGFEIKQDLQTELAKAILWYKDNPDWCK